MLSAQGLQYFMSLLVVHTALLRDERLFDIGIIGEHAAVVSECCHNDGVLFIGHVFQAIKVVASDEETHPCLVVACLAVFYVSGFFKNLECRFHSCRIVFEVSAEFVEVEFESPFEAAAHGELEEIRKMFIHGLDIFLVRILVGDAALQYRLVPAVEKQYGISLVSVSACAPGFLEISLYGVRTVDMYHDPHVRLVYTHAEGIGGYHHLHFVLLPH